MASMTRNQRAQYYYELLLASSTPKSELQRIQRELDSLVYASSQKPLEDSEKLLIIEELERLIKQSPDSMYESLSRPGVEHFEKGKLTASDNSDILDVISAMKRAKGGK